MDICSPDILLQIAVNLGCEYPVLKLVCKEWKSVIEKHENLIVNPNLTTKWYCQFKALSSRSQITESRLFGELHNQTEFPALDIVKSRLSQGRWGKVTWKREWHRFGRIYMKKKWDSNENLILDTRYNQSGVMTNYREPLLSIFSKIDH